MVVRREEDGFRTYCHFGTGNYHPDTARIYTDLSYFTAPSKLGRDAAKLFNFVSGYAEPRNIERLAISPLNLRENLYEANAQEIANVKDRKHAPLWLKCNPRSQEHTSELQ